MNESIILYLVSSSVTRIGAILLLIFGVRILVMLYKYNVRLAVFYSAQADALELIPDSDIDDFSKLVRVLSPDHLDFESTPGVSIKELTDIAQALKQIQK